MSHLPAESVFKDIFESNASLRNNPALVRSLRFGIRYLSEVPPSMTTPNGLAYELEVGDSESGVFIAYDWFDGHSGGLVIPDNSSFQKN